MTLMKGQAVQKLCMFCEENPIWDALSERENICIGCFIAEYGEDCGECRCKWTEDLMPSLEDPTVCESCNGQLREDWNRFRASHSVASDNPGAGRW